MSLYEAARRATDEVCGEGTYARLNWDNPDPMIRAKAREGRDVPPEPPACEDCGEHHDGYGDCPMAYVDDEFPNLARCDYYQDCGICTFGCWEEPACITSGPWPDPEFTAQEANTIAIRRYAWRMQRWMGWRDVKAFMARTRS